MRKFFSLTLAILMVFSTVSVGAISVTATSDAKANAGTEAANVTYLPKQPPAGTTVTQITTAEEFEAMNDSDGVFVLANDITISKSVNTFKGQLYGNGKTVKTSVPLFLTIDGSSLKKDASPEIGASVYDLTITGTINSTGSGALSNVVKDAIIYRVTNDAKVTKNETAVGGLTGSVIGSSASFYACTNNAAVSGKQIGGLVGTAQANSVLFNNCLNNGSVTCTGNGDRFAGGIVGSATTQKASVAFNSCVNTGPVTDSSKNGTAAGIVALCHSLSDLSFTSCRSDGSITGGLTSGGLVGNVRACSAFSVSSCQSYGIISSTTYSGGSIGFIEDCPAVTVKNCTNRADVSAKTYAGGIIASSTGYITIEDCKNSGMITSTADNGLAAGIIALLSYDATETECNTNLRICINNCINLGNVNTKGQAAGIVALSRNIITTQSCINTGTITGEAKAGGIIGTSWSKGGGINGAYGTNIYYCVNRGAIFSVGAAAGIIASAEKANANFIVACVSIGDVTSTNSSANSIAGYIWGKSTVRFNTTMGKLTAAQNAKATPMMNYNNAASRFSHNIFLQNAGDIIGGITMLLCDRNSASIYTSEGLLHDNFSFNYIKKGVVQYHHLLRPDYQPIPADYAYYYEDSDFETTEAVVAKFGENFILNDGIPMYKDVVEVYNISGDPDSVTVFTPSEIKTEAEFLAMDTVGSYKLTADFILHSSYAMPFYGTLDGNGHTITLVGAPMFCEIADATIKSLKLENAVINDSLPFFGAIAPTAHCITLDGVTSSANVTGGGCVGGLIGAIDCAGIFQNCIVSGDVTSVSGDAAGYVSTGIGEATDLIFNNCVYRGKITANHNAGGIYGANDTAGIGTIVFQRCVTSGSVTVSDSTAAGGLAGIVRKPVGLIIDSCSSDAVVTNNAVDLYAGGLLGALTDGPVTIRHSDFNGTVDGAISAGILSYAYYPTSINITDCSVSASATADTTVGGIVGLVTKGLNVEIDDCTVIGSLSTVKGGNLGGVIGNATETVTITVGSCAVTGSFVTTEGGNLGGIIGRATASTNITIDACTATGSFVASGRLAGIIAEATAIADEGKFHITRCVYAGTQPGAAGGDVGGIVGHLLPAAKRLDFKIDGCAVISDLYATNDVAGIAQSLSGISGSKIAYTVSNNLVLGSINSTHTEIKDSAGLVGYYYNGIQGLQLRDNAVFADINMKSNGRSVGAFGGYGNLESGYIENNLFVGSIFVPGRAVLTTTRSDGVIPVSVVTKNHFYLVDGKSFDNLWYSSDTNNALIGEETLKLASASEDATATLGSSWTYVTDYSIRDNRFTGTIPVASKNTLEEVRFADEAPDDPDTTDPDVSDTTDPEASDTVDPGKNDSTTAPNEITSTIDGTTSSTGNDDKKSGCGSVVSATLTLTALSLIAPALIVARKKDTE